MRWMGGTIWVIEGAPPPREGRGPHFITQTPIEVLNFLQSSYNTADYRVNTGGKREREREGRMESGRGDVTNRSQQSSLKLALRKKDHGSKKKNTNKGTAKIFFSKNSKFIYFILDI